MLESFATVAHIFLEALGGLGEGGVELGGQQHAVPLDHVAGGHLLPHLVPAA